MKRIGIILIASVCGSVSILSQKSGNTESVFSESRVIDTMVHSIGLENNLLGDSPDRQVLIYLPPGYDDSPDKHYPVVYLLHGFRGAALYYFGGWVSLQPILDNMIDQGTISPMIVVSSDSRNKYLGSFYTNSSVTGKWEDFVVKDVVQFVDSTFRTLPQVESRGIAGHSMGAYGAIKLAMKHPDIFGSVFSLSGPKALVFEDMITLEREKFVEAATVGCENFDSLAVKVQIRFANAAAFAPNPSLPCLGELPITADGELIDSVWQKWLLHDPYTMLPSYKVNLMQLSAIHLEAGTEGDGAYIPTIHFSQALTEQGINHELDSFPGDHINMVAERIEYSMLPFFSATFSVGVINNSLEELIGIFPNPTSEDLTIQLIKAGLYSIEITSMNGQRIFRKEMEGTTHQLDLSSFQKGIYLITIRSKDFVSTRKIIKL